MPDSLQEVKHGLVDESVPEHRHASSSSHELPLEPSLLISRKTGIVISVWTKITRASCRKRTGTAVPRVENLVIE